MSNSKLSKEDVRHQLNLWDLSQNIFIESIEGGLQEADKVYRSIWNICQDEAIVKLSAPPGMADVVVSLILSAVGGQVITSAALIGIKRLLRGRLAYVNYTINVKIPKGKRKQIRRKLKIDGHKVRKREASIDVQRIHDDGSLASILYNLTPEVADLLGSRVDEFLQEDFTSTLKGEPVSSLVPTRFSNEVQLWYRSKRISNRHLFNILNADIDAGQHESIAEAFASIFQEIKEQKLLNNERSIQEELRKGMFSYKQYFLATLWALHMAPPKIKFGPVTDFQFLGINFKGVNRRKWSDFSLCAAANLSTELIRPAILPGTDNGIKVKESTSTFYESAKARINQIKPGFGRSRDKDFQRVKKAREKAIKSVASAELVIYLDEIYKKLIGKNGMASFINDLQ